MVTRYTVDDILYLLQVLTSDRDERSRKIRVAFPSEVSYKDPAGEDAPPAEITVCHLRKSTRYHAKSRGRRSGAFLVDQDVLC